MKTDCMLYVVSRTHFKNNLYKQTHDTIVLELARKVEEVWNNADCCPYTFKYIAKLFDKEIWQKYLFLKRENYLPGSANLGKRSHKKIS